MGKRFTVEGETCFVTLITEHNSRIGLVIHGQQALRDYCSEAIDAYEEMLKNKEKTQARSGQESA